MTYESQAVRDARIDVGAVLGAVVRRLPRIIALTLLLLAATFVLVMFMPRLYESSASILVEPRNNVFLGASTPSTSGNEAGVISSQIELVKSRDTLLRVIDQLDLRDVPEFNGAGAGLSPMAYISQLLGRKPAPANVEETVLGNLYDRLTVIQERDSALISVLVRSTNPQLAADIANAVANAHVARRAQLSLSDTAEASSWLRDEIDKLRVAVNTAETAVADFKVNNDMFVGSGNTSLADQQLSTISTQISAAQERKNTALSRAQLIRGLIDRGQSIEGVPDVRDSAVIQSLSEEKARLQGERAQRSATLLPNHPSIRAIAAQIGEIEAQIAAEGRSVANALDAEAQIEADVEASLNAELTRAKTSSSTATQDTVTLDGLEREAKAQRDLLEGYLQRYTEAISRTDSNSALPDVRVVTLAAPSVSPASPKTQLILMAVGIVALAAQTGLIVFGELMSGRAIVAGRDIYVPEPATRAQDELEAVPFVEAELEPDQRWEEPEPPVEETPTAPEVIVAEATDPLADAKDEAEPEPEIVQPDDEAEAFDARERFLATLRAASLLDQPVNFSAQADFDTTAADEALSDVAPLADDSADFTPPARHHGVIDFANLAADLVLGRTRVLMLAGHQSNDDCADLAEALVADALDRGLSVALVDAGSARLTDESGLSDLSSDAASFGDVVHKSADNSFAEVPWGQGRMIDRRSSKPMTLVEALGDIYEVVILLTGKVGLASSLPLFADLDARLVLVAGNTDDLASLEEARDQLSDAGFGRAEIVAIPELVAA